jgi:hypothetical protein
MNLGGTLTKRHGTLLATLSNRLLVPCVLVMLLYTAVAAQLNPALTPHKAPQPTLPKIDQNACPFEGCQFGEWKVREPVEIFSTRRTGRKPIRTLRRGESVTAITGMYITFEPSEIQVTAPMPQYGLNLVTQCWAA